MHQDMVQQVRHPGTFRLSSQPKGAVSAAQAIDTVSMKYQAVVHTHVNGLEQEGLAVMRIPEQSCPPLPSQVAVLHRCTASGDSFEPGDVINLRGGEYANRPLDFYQSGSAGSPITYRSSPGEQAVLKSELYQCRSGQAPGLLDKHLDAVRDD